MMITLLPCSFLFLAVVQDAGRTIGVMTLEEVLEELARQIEDETDVERRMAD